ncbi:MAG: mechanosensitive ion channel [Candidatus Competibacteraceae bacterium]
MHSTRLATALGLVTAGLAFALQRVITVLAGYFVILRSRTFNVGDRIRMGGVRGDVIALSFMQTTIMEMGQPRRCRAMNRRCRSRVGNIPGAWSRSAMPRSSRSRSITIRMNFPTCGRK